MDVTRDKAHAAWQRQYPGVRMLELGRDDFTPFTPGPVLGSTNISKVHSLEFGGAVIALKVIHIRKGKHARPSVESNISRSSGRDGTSILLSLLAHTSNQRIGIWMSLASLSGPVRRWTFLFYWMTRITYRHWSHVWRSIGRTNVLKVMNWTLWETSLCSPRAHGRTTKRSRFQ